MLLMRRSVLSEESSMVFHKIETGPLCRHRRHRHERHRRGPSQSRLQGHRLGCEEDGHHRTARNRSAHRYFYGHKEENIIDSDVVVISSAIRADNPEVKKAKELFIPVIQRAEMLAELMRMKYSIAVAGAHGKTTTTSLISTILGHAGIDPTCVIGGRLNSLGSNAKLGDSNYLVAEADESDGTFLLLFPTIAVVTNIDLEHLDFYKDLNEIKAAFTAFLNKVPFYGLDIICIDNANLQSLIPLLKRRYMTYGFSKQADLRAENVIYEGFTTKFKVIYKGYELGEISLEYARRSIM